MRLCVECKWFTWNYRCGRPGYKLNPVHGQPDYLDCEVERKSTHPQACNPDGSYWEQKEPEPIKAEPAKRKWWKVF